MSTPTDDPSAIQTVSHMVDFLISLGPSGVVAAMMWMWKEEIRKDRDLLRDKLSRAIDKALEGDEERH